MGEAFLARRGDAAKGKKVQTGTVTGAGLYLTVSDLDFIPQGMFAINTRGSTSQAISGGYAIKDGNSSLTMWHGPSETVSGTGVFTNNSAAIYTAYGWGSSTFFYVVWGE